MEIRELTEEERRKQNREYREEWEKRTREEFTKDLEFIEKLNPEFRGGEKDIKRLKKTLTYFRYRKLYDFIKNKKSTYKILRAVHELMEAYRGYKYGTRAYCAVRCIELIEKEEQDAKRTKRRN